MRSSADHKQLRCLPRNLARLAIEKVMQAGPDYLRYCILLLKSSSVLQVYFISDTFNWRPKRVHQTGFHKKNTKAVFDE